MVARDNSAGPEQGQAVNTLLQLPEEHTGEEGNKSGMCRAPASQQKMLPIVCVQSRGHMRILFTLIAPPKSSFWSGM